MARDSRSYEIKRLLKGRFPSFAFRVRIDKYSGGESIDIETNLLPPYLPHNEAVWRAERDFNSCSNEDQDAYVAFHKRMDEREQAERLIKDVIGQFEHVDRDDQGDILLGGNTYLHIDALRAVE